MDHKLEPYQQQILDHMTRFKGRGLIQLTGRPTGKSQVVQYHQQWYSMQEAIAPKYKIISQALVDDEPWYTISCHKEVSIWVRENGVEHTDWFEHIDSKWHIHKNVFDVCEEFYMLIVLKFGK